MFSMRPVRLFGVRWSLNQVIAWINHHEKQSQETLAFRADAERRLSSLEERLQALLNREH